MLASSQRDLLFPYIEKVPQGVLILGPAGTGKSFALSGITLLKLGAGKKVSVVALSNVAAANIANKVKAVDKHGRLLLRPWSSCEEENAFMRYVPGRNEWRHVDSSPWRGHDRFILEMSVAEAVLMMCGQLPTTNQKLLSLREQNVELAHTLATRPDLREIEMKRDLRSRARRAANAVMSVADASFTTSAQALLDLVKQFTEGVENMGDARREMTGMEAKAVVRGMVVNGLYRICEEEQKNRTYKLHIASCTKNIFRMMPKFFHC